MGLIKFDLPQEEQDFNVALENFAYYEKSLIQSKEIVSRVYPFSNENLGDLFSKIDVKGKKVAVVGSSGDQVIYALANGAKEITLLDSNPMALPHTELKLATIKVLSFEEFRKFFSNENIFNVYFYRKVSHELSPQSREFWDNIYLYSDTTNSNLVFNLCQQGRYDSYFKVALDLYKTPDIFNKAKANLQDCEIDFIHADFSKFSERLKDREKYDYIFLSNIADYVGSDKYFQGVDSLKDCLTDDGRIQIYYDFERSLLKGYKFIDSFAKYMGNEKLRDENLHNKRKNSTNYNIEGFEC
ncbi:MAG: DUF3419 family protein, partial [Christensenellales bacterium]